MDKGKVEIETIDKYIAQFPKEIQEILETVRMEIKQAAPGAVEKISYRMPAFVLNGKILVYFAAFKNHIGFYPTASGIESFKDQFSKYKWSKGAVQFPIKEPLPYELIRQIVKFRAEENMR
ncbi:MAG: iron chaperone [Solirubrobacterales bacterium]